MFDVWETRGEVVFNPEVSALLDRNEPVPPGMKCLIREPIDAKPELVLEGVSFDQAMDYHGTSGLKIVRRHGDREGIEAL
jgi:hypothetical protein